MNGTVAHSSLSSGEWAQPRGTTKLQQRLNAKFRRGKSRCTNCKAKKVKCDEQRPCRRCTRMGLASSCVTAQQDEEGEVQPGGETSVVRPHGACSTGGNLDNETQCETQQLRLFDPELPIRFPDSICYSSSSVGRSSSLNVGLPRSYYGLFRSWSYPPLAQHVFVHSTPRLRSAILKVFGAMDRAALQRPTLPERAGANVDQSTWAGAHVDQRPSWETSRCGFFTFKVSFTDFSTATIPQQVTNCYLNDYWAAMRGWHREEAYTRLLSHDSKPFSTELRYTCRLLWANAKMFRLQMGLMTWDDFLREDFWFGRYSHSDGRGVVARTRIQRFCATPGSKTPTGGTAWSTVVLTPEEYDEVTSLHPELCEPFASEVVGPKTAAELTSPNLEVEESFAALSATEEGRATLDRLAAVIEKEFAFVLKAES